MKLSEPVRLFEEADAPQASGWPQGSEDAQSGLDLPAYEELGGLAGNGGARPRPGPQAARRSGRAPQPPSPTLAPSPKHAFGRLTGRSRAMRQVFALLERVAPSDVSILIEAETGTGKELCAEAIHAHSRRAGGPLVVVDLAGIQPNLIESELFGHVRGAFTGAVSERPGAFERASGGTIFLDEIGELPPALQPRLLRALEGRQAKRVGGNDYKPFDVRILAATNRNLLEEVGAGRFRADLYHRLSVMRVGLPPLRARPDDLPLLAGELLRSMGWQGTLDPEVGSLLARHEWPGNVRELRNVLECAISLAGGGPLSPELFGLAAHGDGAPSPLALPFKEAKERVVSAFEREYLAGVLDRCGGNVSRAAREAGLDRVYLHRLLRKHDLG